MTREHLELLVARVATWPKPAQEKFVRTLENIERTDAGLYPLSAEEQAAIEEGLAQAERGQFASDEELEALLKRSWA